MKLGIMQPYFFPYIGYFQLINSVDLFVVYDNIKFVKKGWIHRNRILMDGSDTYISLSIKKSSDYLDVREKWLADDWDPKRSKVLRQIEAAYKKAPFFKDVFPLVEMIINFPEKNLFSYLWNSIKQLVEYMEINTKLIVSSEVSADHSLKGEDRVLAVCKSLDTTYYINPIGGLTLYSSDRFRQEGITLSFLKSECSVYRQFGSEFVPNLSIIDVLMFNEVKAIRQLLKECSFVSN